MNNKHNYVVDIVKILAAILVIFSHSFDLSNNTVDMLYSFTNGVINLGATAVAIFFTYSGFYVCKSLLKNGDDKYVSKRLKRLIPELLIVVLISMFIIGPIYSNLSLIEYFTNPGTYLYILNAIMIPIHNLPGVFTNNILNSTVNGALWTMSVEFACYIYLLILYKLKGLNEKKVLFGYICSLVLAIVGLFTLNFICQFINVSVLKSAIRPFMVFITAAFISVKFNKIDKRIFIVSIIMFIVLLLSKNYYFVNIAYIFFLPFMLMYISSTFAIKGNKYISFVGESSYTVYLFGFVVQQCVVSSFGGVMKPYINFVISTFIALILGFLLNGFMKYLRKKIEWL